MKRIVTFGEMMLRLSPPGYEVLFQSPCFDANFSGAEANVAVSLANFGEKVALVTILPDNPLGRAALAEMRKFNVDTDAVIFHGERLGLYFAEKGTCARPSKVIYDRDHSAMAGLRPDLLDWDRILDGAKWFHFTGITPAIGKGAAEAVEKALRVCRGKNIRISCDLNYRKKLWNWGSTAQEVMPGLVEKVDILVANEEDCQMSLGLESSVDVTSGSLETRKYRVLAERVMERFRNLEFVAITLRESISASHNNWSAILLGKDLFHESRKYSITDIVDRIGGGDSFSAGLIHSMINGKSPGDSLEFAVAASALKHTIKGDFNRIYRDDVLRVLGGDASGRVQR